MRKSSVVILACFAALLPSITQAQAPAVPALYPAPTFRLTNQDAQVVTNEDLRGKTWVVDFIFTRCPGPCPVMTSKMVALSKAVASPDVRFVSISVDPAYDTPAVLKKYAEVRGATNPRFIFLTGDRKTIYELAGVTPPAASDEDLYRGEPLASPPKGAALVFYAAWPALAGGAAYLSLRRQT